MFSIPLGPFDLQTPIGKGGMGEVWRGVHRVQQVPVAVKVMTGARARQRRYREAFLNEVRAVATLNHPGVVMIFDYGTVTAEAEERSARRLVARSPYLVMELASRGSLDQIRGIIPWSDLKRFLISLLDALAHAHARGVIHRDLKPGNVLVCADTDLRPGLKLTDFGLAHAQDETGPGLTQHRAGTPRYMAPELFEGNWRDYGPWTDLYALGCMAYEMCSNRPMFDGQDFQSLKRQHLYEPPPALKARQPVPDEFESWLIRLVQKKPHERYQCAADAAWALMRMDLEAGSGNFNWSMDLPAMGDSTNLMSNMSGLGEVSTFFFPELPWSMTASTMMQPDDDIHRAATHMFQDRPVQDASTYLFPDYDLAQSPTYLYSGGLPRAQRQRRPTYGEPIEESASDPMAVAPAPMPPTWKHAEAGPPSMQLVGVGLRLFELRTVRMVGREKERDTIWKQLKEVKQSGQARLVLLHGPAGVGKSRMAQRISERALEVGAATVLRATHDPMSASSEGLSRMVARHLGALGMRRPEIRRRTRKLLQEQGVTDPYEWDALTEMLSSSLDTTVMVRAKPIQFAGPVERYVLVRRLLEREGRERPVIVWLDDVQWGSDSIAFAEYLMKGQAVAPSPVLVLLTVRDETLAERPIEREMLEGLMRLEDTHDIPLEPLNVEEMRALVEELLGLSPDLARLVEKRTQGNPLFAAQLVGDWVSRGALEVTEAGFVLKEGERADLPDDIHQVWSSRVARLLDDEDDSAMLALEIAAVLGLEVDALEWESACKEAGLRLSFHLLYKLISARLAQPADNVWTFAHSMLRESLERNARDVGRWQAHNRACADMLKKRYPGRPPGVSERLGRHLMAAEDFAAALAPLLQGAREHLEDNEYRGARNLLGMRTEALMALDVPEEDANHGQGWVIESEISRREGHLDEALQLAVKAVRYAKNHGWETVKPSALESLGHVYRLMGNLERARTAYIQARKLYGREDDFAGIVNCQRGLGQVAHYRGELSRATELLHHALSTSKLLKDKRRVAECLQATCPVVLQRGDLQLAADLNRRAMQLHEKEGNTHGVAECRREEARIAVLQGDLDRGASLYEDALQQFERLGAIHGITTCLRGLAEIALLRGWFDTARDGYERVLFLHEASGLGDLILPRIELGWVLFKEGKHLAARETFAECLDMARAEELKTVVAVALSYLVASASQARDWMFWWESFHELESLLESIQIVDAHVALALQEAGGVSAEATQFSAAKAAYTASRRQWEVLGRQDRLAEIDGALLRIPLDEVAEVEPVGS
ncbi:MAG: hypothetical protein CMH57_13750 [Myxococcales bacterium]|nr:hypothetical protein [Myxococcales bacterium]